MLRILKQYFPLRNALFVIGEGFFLLFSVLIATQLLLKGYDPESFFQIFLKSLLIAIICQACLYYNDLYDLNVTDSIKELCIRLLQALGASAILLAVIYIIFPSLIIGRGIFGASIAIVVVFIVSWRIAYAQILKRGLFDQNIILLGSGKLSKDIISEIRGKRDCGYKIAAAVEEHTASNKYHDKKMKYICQDGYDALCEQAKNLNAKKIVVAIEEKRKGYPVNALLECRVAGINVLEGASFYEMLAGKLSVEQINPAWLIFSDGFQKSKTRVVFKRFTDIVLSFAMLVVLSPILSLLSMLIKIDSPGPVFFSQERVGERGRVYRVHKFRSMCKDAEKKTGPVWAQTDDVRVTRIGKFIRKWRIDEIPQLWNVLKGEMSFVGPRPEREHFVKELEIKIPYYGERFTVKPGVTGWAQVCYPYGASVEDAKEKLNYDLFYIKNMSFLMDLMIIMRTVKTVIFGHGAR